MTSSSDLLQADIDARIDALDTSHSFIVQAPAGSGKTELLIQRYLKLLSVVDDPEEVIAITFTRKAAAEMQTRVLQALWLGDERCEPGTAHERLTYTLALEALAQSDSRQWALLSNPRRMRILTLDALNTSITRSRPLSSPGTGTHIVTGAALGNLYREAALATLDWLATTDEMSLVAADILEHVDNNTALYASYLAEMLATRDQWLPFIGSGQLDEQQASEIRERFELHLQESIADRLQRASDALGLLDESAFCALADFAASNLVAAGDLDNAIVELRGLTELPRPVVDELPRWRGIGELLLTQQRDIRKRLIKTQGFPPGRKVEKEQFLEMLSRLSDSATATISVAAIPVLPPPGYDDRQWSVLLNLFRLLPLAVSELKRLFGEKAVSDHTEIALHASATMGSAEDPGDVALLLDYSVRHLLVDEMQDTSAAQYRLLDTLTGGWQRDDGRTLFCVGDPMQSIYRFRNAEVGQFLLLRESGIGELALSPLVLRRNFRSGEWLVAWFNTVFPLVFPEQDDAVLGAVSYAEAVPVQHLEGKGSCTVHAAFGPDKKREAAIGQRLLANLLHDHPEDSVAVLVRSRTHLPELLAALRQGGIDYQAVEIDRLTDLPEVIELLALTRAACHLGDRLAWLAILRAPWIGLDWPDLHALVRNDRHLTVFELLQDEERLNALSDYGRRQIARVRHSLATLTEPRRTTGLRDIVERCWIELGGPAVAGSGPAVDNCYRFLDVLQRIEEYGTLVDVAELERTLDLERVSSSDKARLQVMTMHRAKGLQFDHVVLFGLGRAPGRSNRKVMTWHDIPADSGQERRIVSPIGPRADVEHDPIHRFIELSDEEKSVYEQARLLYVACTRAKASLHLIGHTSLKSDGSDFGSPRRGSLLHILWPSLEAEFARQFESTDPPEERGEDERWGIPRLRRFREPWVPPEARTLTTTGHAKAAPGEDRSVEFYWVGSEARLAGTLVHRYLQLLAEAPASIAACPVTESIIGRWIVESGLDDDAGKRVLARAKEAIAAMLDDEKGRWILSGKGHTELQLQGMADGELVSVVLDRVRVDDDGTHWIIDYKTSSHEGGDLDAFLAAERTRYEPQMSRYKSLYQAWSGSNARVALYFPLLRTFLEIKL